MIHIRGQHKIVLILHQRQKLRVNIGRCFHIAVVIDMAAPPCPVRFLVRKRKKSAGIHIADAESVCKVSEILLKSFTVIYKAGCRRKSGSRADHDGVRRLQLPCEYRHLSVRLFGHAGGHSS